MTTKTFLTLAIAVFGATSAFAGEIETDHPVAFTSSISRADVQGATVQARAAGLIPHGDRTVAIEPTGAGLSRVQVRAEAIQALRLGLASRGEHNVFPTAEQLESIRMAGQKALRTTMASL